MQNTKVVGMKTPLFLHIFLLYFKPATRCTGIFLGWFFSQEVRKMKRILTFYLINLTGTVGAPLELKKLKVFLNDVLPKLSL